MHRSARLFLRRQQQQCYNLTRQNQRYSRNFNATCSSFSSSSCQYEYPDRTEAPIITHSVPDDSSATSTTSTTTTTTTTTANTNGAYTANFDESQTLSPSERSSILSQQKQKINTKLPPSYTIQTTPPSFIPPNLPQDSLETPTTKISTLPNGLRIASRETYGQVCTFGIVSKCGSRLEKQNTSLNDPSSTTGVNHLMELLAFCGTKKLDSTSYQNKLGTLGGASYASSSREQFLYCIDVLRPNIDEAMDMLQDVVLNPDLNDDVLEEMKKVIEFQWMDIMPEILTSEGLHMAAYGPLVGQMNQQQQLGKSHLCPLEALPSLNAETIINFRNQYLLNPNSMVISGAGIEHEHLVSLSEKYFGHLQSNTTPNPNEPFDNNHMTNGIIPSTYTGGDHRQTITTPDGSTLVALAFPTGGWHSDDVIPAIVLQTLLGGGNSFSAGGPGKGMYSRLYRQVMNRYYWMESVEAFTSFHAESGLLGINGKCAGHKAGDLTRVLAEHIMRLAVDLVDDEELDRARNMLKCEFLTHLESRLVLFEDVGRQILTYDKREDSQDLCDKIDAVTKEDLRELARATVLGMKPTLCSVGDDISQVPAFDDVERWFKTL